MNAHHLNAWASFPQERYDVENGVCLCQNCHDRFHDTYGKGKNTKEQFYEFKSLMEELIKIANKEAIINCTARKMLQTAERDTVVKQIVEHLDGYYV